MLRLNLHRNDDSKRRLGLSEIERVKGSILFFFFFIFLKDIVLKINLCNLTCELLKLTKLWLFEGRDDC